MSENPKYITAGEDCSNCRYCETCGKNTIRCTARDRTYYYGQYVPCENREEKN